MESDLIFENEFAKGSYYKELKLAEILWKKTLVPSEEYRKAFDSIIKFTENVDFVNYLSDGRKQGVVSPDDRKWFQNVIVPKAMKLGLKYGAVVIKKDPFKKYYMNANLRWLNRKSKITMRIFYDYDEAINWIKRFL